MAHDAEDVRSLLCRLGDHVRELVMDARGSAMSDVVGATAADTIYAVDKVADDALIGWFEDQWPDVRVVSEGLDEPVVLGSPEWTVIVDTIDGTRGLMYDKRPAWCLAGAAPLGGSLADIAAAAMTELPVVKQGMADQLSATKGGGIVAERIDLRNGSARGLEVRPSSATDLEHGFSQVAKFLLPGKVALSTLEAHLFERLGCHVVFDDEYLSNGGQLYELITGRDRFVADLRPLVVDHEDLASHPYDVCTSMLLGEVGGKVTDPWGGTLDVALDTVTPVAWVGFANKELADWIGPILAEIVDELPVR